MELHHCTEFGELREIFRLSCLKIGELLDYPALMKLGFRGVWLSTAAYGDQFFGPYRFTFDANDLLPERFLILKKTEKGAVVLASHSPVLEEMANILGLATVRADDETTPLRMIENCWSAVGKVDVICDFSIPTKKAKHLRAGTSSRTRPGAAPNPLNRTNPISGARLLALMLRGGPSAVDEIVVTNIQELAKNLFRTLEGRNFEKRVTETHETFSVAERTEIDILQLAAECLVDDNVDGAMLIASLAGSSDMLAQKVAAAVTQRFPVASIDVSLMLAD
jgi:hypothetical protein